MKSALIFLNGHYDLRYPQFYKESPDVGGGKQSTHSSALTEVSAYSSELNQTIDTPIFPNVLIGDLDSRRGNAERMLLNSWSGLARTSSVNGLGKWTRTTQTDSWQSLMQLQSIGCQANSTLRWTPSTQRLRNRSLSRQSTINAPRTPTVRRKSTRR